MIASKDIDFLKQAQIKNVLIHTIADLAELSNKSQLAFYDSERRLYIFDGESSKSIAYQSDIVENVNVYFQEDDPRGVELNPLPKTAIWFRASTNEVFMYNIDTNVWATLTSNAVTGTTLADFVGGTTYPPNSVVIESNKLYKNNSGADISDALFNAANWVNIGNTVDAADIRLSTFAILTTITDGTTVNNVERTGNSYKITHSFNKQYPTVFILETSTLELIETDITFTDVDNLTISLPIELPFNMTVIVKE